MIKLLLQTVQQLLFLRLIQLIVNMKLQILLVLYLMVIPLRNLQIVGLQELLKQVAGLVQLFILQQSKDRLMVQLIIMIGLQPVI